MSDPTTFADLWDQFLEGWEQFQNDFNDGIDHCAGIIDKALGGIGQFLDDITPMENTAEKAQKYWNEDIYPALIDGYNECVDQVSELVSDLAGDPLALQGYAEDFSKAIGKIFVQRGYDEAAAALDKTWAGDAYDAYNPVAKKQDAALKLLSDALTKGGELTSAAAAKILSVWANLIHQFSTFYSEIISTLSGAASVDNILTFGVKSLLDLISKIWKRVSDIVKILADFMIAQATTDSVRWVAIAAGSGGLAGNEWPPISETSSDGINDPAGWGAPTG